MSPGSKRAPWQESLAPLSRGCNKRGALAVLTSLVPYLAIFVTMYLTLGVSPLLTIALAIINAGFLVRVFIVFHDCTHGSLLPSKRANTIVGSVCGLFVLAPFARWKHEHWVHHATSGDLDRRGVGDVPTLTIAEYRAMSRPAQIGYRLFRNPLIMFGLGPIFAMIVGPRLVGKGVRPRLRNSVLLTDAALAVIITAAVLVMGWQDFLLVWGPTAMLAGSAGIWLFYVQHQFEDVYWQRSDEWDYAEAALQGSSYLKLPAILQFFTGNIGLHHVHHLNARIPFYYLPQAAADPVFATVPVLSVWDGLRAVRFKLYDEQAGRLVTWAEASQVVLAKPKGASAAAGA